jgi:hypothetical protein
MENQQAQITNELNREKLILPKEDGHAILDGDSDTFKTIEDKIVGKSRWSIAHMIIIQRLSDNKFFKGFYSCGATENQMESPWEYDDPEFNEVFEKEKIVKVYE